MKLEQIDVWCVNFDNSGREYYRSRESATERFNSDCNAVSLYKFWGHVLEDKFVIFEQPEELK